MSVQRGRGEDELKVGDKCAKGVCKGCAMGVPRPLYALACNRQACKGGGQVCECARRQGANTGTGDMRCGVTAPLHF